MPACLVPLHRGHLNEIGLVRHIDCPSAAVNHNKTSLPPFDFLNAPDVLKHTTMTMESRRPRSSQRVSVSWDEVNTALARSTRLQFEVAECVETKTVTTTTTTKRSYPPLLVREPRPLSSLDSKEYPLALRPTPPELASFTFDLGGNDAESWAVGEDGLVTGEVSKRVLRCRCEASFLTRFLTGGAAQTYKVRSNA